MNRSSTSPFRGIGSRPGPESLEAVIRSLEQENNILVDQISALKIKCKKVSELEDKNQMILRHNTQLLNQNERLAKLINQKKSQIQIWKNKHDSVLANRSTASDLEVKRLLSEIDKLKEEASEIEHAKNLQINEIKNQQHLELQNIKRNSLSSAQKYELQIRKLKQFCDKKDYEVSDLKMKIARISKQTDFQITKLRQQKQRLRTDMQFQQNQHRKQLESLKNKYDFNYHNQIENIKKQHLNQVQTLDYQNNKLKQVINSKNIQLQQSILKQNKMRNHYQDSIELLKKQNTQLKQKIIESQHIADLQLANLRQKLDGIKQSQLALLKDANNNQQDILTRQISKLKKFLDSRNEEIQFIVKEKNQIKQNLQADLRKKQAEKLNQINQKKQLEVLLQQKQKQKNQFLKLQQQQFQTVKAELNSHISTLKQQQHSKQESVKQYQKHQQQQKNKIQQKLNKCENQILKLNKQNSQIHQQHKTNHNKASTEIQNMKKAHEIKINHLQKTINGFKQQIRQNDNVANQLKQHITILQLQLKQKNESIVKLQNTQNQLRKISSQNFTKSNLKQQQLNRLIKQQIQKQQINKKTQISQFKSIYQNKISTLNHHIKQLQRNVRQKNTLINDLKLKYQLLSNNFQKVFGQEASRKNLDIKIPGWMPDTLAIKSLFDVFLKTKVIDYCQVSDISV